MSPGHQQPCHLTHWGRVTHICIGKTTIIGSDNGLAPGRRQAIIWTNAGILSIGLLGTNFIEILIGIQTFSFKKMHLKMSSAKCCQFCLSLNVLITSMYTGPCLPIWRIPTTCNISELRNNRKCKLFSCFLKNIHHFPQGQTACLQYANY